MLQSLYLIRGKDFSVVIYVLLWTQQYRRMKKEQRVEEPRMKDTGNDELNFVGRKSYTEVEWVEVTLKGFYGLTE